VTKAKVKQILALLDEHYPPQPCFLEYKEPWQLLFATILSAQCTDARVNMVTRDLYVKYPDLQAFAGAELSGLEEDIRSTGFYHNKALHIKAAAIELLSRFGGELPSDIESLTSLPGVGRKTANVVRTHIFGIPSIVVDTHVKRVSKLLGITHTDDPVKAEFELMDILPKDHWSAWNQQIITHGRQLCISGRPKCGECFLNGMCENCAKKK
jgi:endonuclease-3